MNFLLLKHNIKKRILPECYNMTNMWRKNLLHMPPEVRLPCWWPDELIFLETAWVYHFAGIPGGKDNPRDCNYWIERTYKHLYEKSK